MYAAWEGRASYTRERAVAAAGAGVVRRRSHRARSTWASAAPAVTTRDDSTIIFESSRLTLGKRSRKTGDNHHVVVARPPSRTPDCPRRNVAVHAPAMRAPDFAYARKIPHASPTSLR